MKIHSDILDQASFESACTAAGMRGVYLLNVVTKGSRSRKRSFDVYLSGTSKHVSGYAGGRGQAATWDEWGMFINALYEMDPEALVGQYKERQRFELATVGRFRSLTAPYQHETHKWENGPEGTRSQFCRDCVAEFAWGVLTDLK